MISCGLSYGNRKRSNSLQAPCRLALRQRSNGGKQRAKSGGEGGFEQEETEEAERRMNPQMACANPRMGRGADFNRRKSRLLTVES